MRLLAIVGPTASGKSALALELARRTGATILSVDSMQVYRGMDIGTAKPSLEERAEIPHWMIDLVDPEIEFSVAEFQAEARRLLSEGDGPVIIAGGSGLHYRSVVDPLEFPPSDPGLRGELEALDLPELQARLLRIDPDAAGVVDLDNPRRVIRAIEVSVLTGITPTERHAAPEAEAVRSYAPLLPFVGVGLDPGEVLAERIAARTRDMIDRGLVEEVAGLAGRLGRTAGQAVGYRELLRVVAGHTPLEEAVAEIEANSMALARRQRTWFRRDPRIEWIDGPTDLAETVAYCLELWSPH